jgi:hypothetical protein
MIKFKTLPKFCKFVRFRLKPIENGEEHRKFEAEQTANEKDISFSSYLGFRAAPTCGLTQNKQGCVRTNTEELFSNHLFGLRSGPHAARSRRFQSDFLIVIYSF